MNVASSINFNKLPVQSQIGKGRFRLTYQKGQGW